MVACSAVFVFSCLCAVCCVHCCCRYCCCCSASRRRRLKLHRGSPRDETIPFEGLPQSPLHSAPVKPKRTWAELHTEWDVEPPKNPGKILLLYSPDSAGFKELQAGFRGFLEQACHCVVLDFFDEQLFQEIAFDPEAWLTKLLADPDFKVRQRCIALVLTLSLTDRHFPSSHR